MMATATCTTRWAITSFGVGGKPILVAGVFALLMVPSMVEAQSARSRVNRPSINKPSRPYSRGSSGHRRRSGLPTAHRNSSINRNGTSQDQINSFLMRPGSLLRGNSYTAPIRRLSVGTAATARMYAPTQAELDAAIAAIRESGPSEQRNLYSKHMSDQILAQRRRLLEDGWAYFKDRDYLRSRAAFKTAETIDSRAPAPRFGQIIVDVANQHFRRAMTQLARSVSYDARRSPNAEGLFEHNVSLRKVFRSEDELREAILHLREFAQRNLDVPAVQALYCYVLWYSRYQDAMIEASSIAARLRRTATDPNSPWARFDGLIQAAREKMDSARRAADARGGNQ